MSKRRFRRDNSYSAANEIVGAKPKVQTPTIRVGPRAAAGLLPWPSRSFAKGVLAPKSAAEASASGAPGHAIKFFIPVIDRL